MFVAVAPRAVNKLNENAPHIGFVIIISILIVDTSEQTNESIHVRFLLLAAAAAAALLLLDGKEIGIWISRMNHMMNGISAKAKFVLQNIK